MEELSEEEFERRQRKEGAAAEKEAGTAAYKKKEFEQALEHYSKAFELDGPDVTYLTNRAAVYLEMGKVSACCLPFYARCCMRGWPQCTSVGSYLTQSALCGPRLGHPLEALCGPRLGHPLEALWPPPGASLGGTVWPPPGASLGGTVWPPPGASLRGTVWPPPGASLGGTVCRNRSKHARLSTGFELPVTWIKKKNTTSCNFYVAALGAVFSRWGADGGVHSGLRQGRGAGAGAARRLQAHRACAGQKGDGVRPRWPRRRRTTTPPLRPSTR